MNKILGKIRLPGDKSISHRAAFFSALRPDLSTFSNFNFNQDCSATLACLRQLGIEWEIKENTLQVKGRDISDWKKPEKLLDAQNSGTTARLLSGILASLNFETTLSGDDSLKKRPMKRILDPLSKMGAKIESDAENLPIHFQPVDGLTAIRYNLSVASAQVKSCILLAGLFSAEQTEVIETKPSRDHTERLLKLPNKQNTDGSQSYFSSNANMIPDLSMTIPGDFSSAAFFIAAALMLPGSNLQIESVSLNPSRTGLLSILEEMGANIVIQKKSDEPEPVGDLIVRDSVLNNISPNTDIIPNIIDEIPILAIMATQATGRFELRNAKELRFKESDRITLMVENLMNVGVDVQEFEDGFAFDGPCELKAGSIRTAGDHRIAMAFAIANLLTEDVIHIDDPSCVAVSFPSFWDILQRIAT